MGTPTSPSTLSTQDERIIAALSHISALLPMMGLIAPITIWVTQREKSRYIAFQALQAIAFQLAFILLWITGIACYIGSFFMVFFGSAIVGGVLRDTNAGPMMGGMFIIPFIIIISMFVLFFVMIIYGIVAAVMTFQGKDFRYALIGRWVERYMQRASA